MLLSFRINPSVTAKVTASPRATWFFFFTHLWYGVSDLCAFGPTEGLSPHADVPVLAGFSLWHRGTLDKPRGSCGYSQFSVWIPCKCSLFWVFLMVLVIACHFCSLTKAILIFPGFDVLCQHFLVLKVPKHTVFISTLTILYLYHITKPRVWNNLL